MQRLALLILVSTLCGCASSPSDLLSKPPDLALQSTKDVKAVADCILLRWENTAGGVGTQRESATGYRLLYIRESELGQMVEVDVSRPAASHAFTTGHPIIGMPNHWRQAVADCQ